MSLRIRIFFERAVVRRNDFLVEPESRQVCVESGIRHDADDDVGIIFFNGAAKAENF